MYRPKCTTDFQSVVRLYSTDWEVRGRFLAVEEALLALQFQDEIPNAAVDPSCVTARASRCVDEDSSEGFDFGFGCGGSVLDPGIDGDPIDTAAQPIGSLLRRGVGGDADTKTGPLGLLASIDRGIDRSLDRGESCPMAWAQIKATVDDQACVVESAVDQEAKILSDVRRCDGCTDVNIGAVARLASKLHSIDHASGLIEIGRQGGFPIASPGSVAFPLGVGREELKFDSAGLSHALWLERFVDPDRDDFVGCAGGFRLIES